MYQINPSLLPALATGACAPRLRSGGVDLRVMSAKLTSTCCPSRLTIGSVCAAQLDARLWGTCPAAGAEVTLEARVGQTYLPLGTFRVAESHMSDDAGELVAYDAAQYAMEADYVPGTTNPPATALAVLADICAQCGLTLGSTEGLTDQSVTPAAGWTCREMAGYMAALLGCNAVVDRTGALALRWFADSAQSVTPDVYYSGALKLEAEQTLAGVRMVKRSTVTTTSSDGITTEEEQTTTYSAGSGSGVVIEVENPFATQAIVDAVWTRLRAAVTNYRTGSCACFGGLTVEPGDLLSITDAAGNTCAFPVMSAVLELDGGCRATVSGSAEPETAAGAQGPTGRLLSQVQADLAQFKELTADNFSAAVAKVNNLYADSTWVQSLFAQHIEADSLDISGDSVFRGRLETGSANVAGVVFGENVNVTQFMTSLHSFNPGESTSTVIFRNSASDPPFYADPDSYLMNIYVEHIMQGSVITVQGSSSQRVVSFVAPVAGDQTLNLPDGADHIPATDPVSVTVTLPNPMQPGYLTVCSVRQNYGLDGNIIIPGHASIGGNLLVDGTIHEGGTKLARKYAPCTHNHDSTYLPLAGGAVSGALSVQGLPMVLPAGDFARTFRVAAGVGNGSRAVRMEIPLSRPLPSGAAVTCKDLTISLRHVGGGFPYVVSGSTYTQLGNNQGVIWANGSAKRSNEVSSITCENNGDSILLLLTFVNTIRVNSSGTTAIANNSPAFVEGVGTFTITAG